MFLINFGSKDNLFYKRVRRWWSPFKDGWTPFIYTRKHELSPVEKLANFEQSLGVVVEEGGDIVETSAREVLRDCAEQILAVTSHVAKTRQANSLRTIAEDLKARSINYD